MSNPQARANRNTILHLFGGTAPDIGPQLKAIAAGAYDNLLLADGPPQPDYELLDLCGDALHFAKAAMRAYESQDPIPHWDAPGRSEWDIRNAERQAEYKRNQHEVTQRLRRAQKMKATTPAGIYAKALLVRCSVTGATGMAMSLATDLIECAALRDTLWPAEPVTP